MSDIVPIMNCVKSIASIRHHPAKCLGHLIYASALVFLVVSCSEKEVPFEPTPQAYMTPVPGQPTQTPTPSPTPLPSTVATRTVTGSSCQHALFGLVPLQRKPRIAKALARAKAAAGGDDAPLFNPRVQERFMHYILFSRSCTVITADTLAKPPLQRSGQQGAP